MKNYIGVIGGVGPYAGLYFFQKWLSSHISQKDQDFNPVIIASIPHEIVDRTEYLLNRSLPNPGFAIASQIAKLYQAGARIFCVYCNTAHAKPIWDVVCSETINLPDIKLVNIIASVLEDLGKIGMQKIGLLSTLGTYREGIYEQYQTNHRLQIIKPNKQHQEKVHQAIYDRTFGIKKLGFVSDESQRLIEDAVLNMTKEDRLDGIILGCTELSMTYSKLGLMDGIKLFDPTDILISKLKEHLLHTT